MTAKSEPLDAEIARLESEVRSLVQMPRTIAERVAEAERELRDAENVYRSYGLRASAGHPGEAAHLQRQALIGLCMVVGADKILKAERARIEHQGEGMSATDKQRRLEQLRAAILRAAARRELAFRAVEGEGEFRARDVHPELLIYKQTAVEGLAG